MANKHASLARTELVSAPDSVGYSAAVPRTSLVILSLALILTTAKGLKIGGAIGPGEILLVGYFMASLVLPARDAGWSLKRPLFAFWYVLFLALVSGYFVRSNLAGVPDPFPRTLFAFAFVATVLAALIRSGHLSHFSYSFARVYTLLLAALSAGVVILTAAGIRNVGGISLYWLGSSRFQGWALDPNQFTIPFIVAPFLAAYITATNGFWGRRWLGICVIAVMMVIPVATQSDSLILGWVCGLFVLLVFSVVFKRTNSGSGAPCFQLISLGVLGSMTVYALVRTESIVSAIEEFFGRDGQADARIAIWKRSWMIISESPLVGFGPDAGLDLSGGDVGEAHNNFLFLGVNSGLIGMLAYTALIGYVALRIWRSRNPFLLAGFVSIVAFGMTHSTLRHPIYWFAIIVLDAIAMSRTDSANHTAEGER